MHEMHDGPTLRLASIELSETLLENFIVYERELLTALAQSKETQWSGRLAFAHAKALQKSTLDISSLHKIRSLVSEFCGKRSVAKLAAQKGVPSHRVDDLTSLKARAGEGAVELLMKRQDELLELHSLVAKAESSGALHLGVHAQA
jgi:hypothetical protein